MTADTISLSAASFIISTSWPLGIQGTSVGVMTLSLPLKLNTSSSWMAILIGDRFNKENGYPLTLFTYDVLMKPTVSTAGGGGC